MTQKISKKQAKPKADEVLRELKKLLHKEWNAGLIYCEKEIKCRYWYDAFKNHEHATSCRFILDEIEHYEEMGEWL